MPGIDHLEAKIAQLEELMEELDAKKRDANATLKLLQKERREVEAYLKTVGKKMVEEEVTRVVKTELDIMGPKLRAHADGIYDTIRENVDKIVDLSLGKEFAISHDRVDLRPLLAEKLRLWIKEIIRTEGLPIT